MRPYGSTCSFLGTVTGVCFWGLAVPSQAVFGSGKHWNEATPKSSVLMGCSMINPPATGVFHWGIPIYGNPYMIVIDGECWRFKDGYHLFKDTILCVLHCFTCSFFWVLYSVLPRWPYPLTLCLLPRLINCFLDHQCSSRLASEFIMRLPENAIIMPKSASESS